MPGLSKDIRRHAFMYSWEMLAGVNNKSSAVLFVFLYKLSQEVTTLDTTSCTEFTQATCLTAAQIVQAAQPMLFMLAG